MKKIKVILISLILFISMIGCESSNNIISKYVIKNIEDEFVFAITTGKTIEFISTHFISNM
jgi:hypothetical protein